MSKPAFRVWTEQLLLPFGNLLTGMQVRQFEPEAPAGTVICFHSFTGNGGDFDTLAHTLALNGYLVVCPDMIGRGDSGYFDAPRRYSFRNSIRMAGAVLRKYGHPDTAVIAAGWGAMVTLALLDAAQGSIRRLLLCETPLHYAPSADAILARAVADVGRSFPTREDAARHVLASPEFAAVAGGDPGTVAHRIRAAETGFRLNYDDGIVGRLSDVAGRRFDFGQLLGKAGGSTLLLYGQGLDEDARGSVEAARATNPNLLCIDAVTPAGPALLRSPAELLLALGFIGGRLPGAG